MRWINNPTRKYRVRTAVEPLLSGEKCIGSKSRKWSSVTRIGLTQERVATTMAKRFCFASV